MIELKRYKIDRETWERDRTGLQQRVQDLEAGKVSLDGSRVPESFVTPGPEGVLSLANLEVLREEIVRLRQSCAKMGAALREIKEQGDQKLDEALLAISSIREHIKSKQSPPRS